MRHYIYGLIDPRDYKVRYVGRTSGRIEKRLAEHSAKAHAGDQAPVYEWLRSLPGPPWLVRLEKCQGLVPGTQGIRAAGVPAEIKWIKRFRRDLLNDIARESGKRDWTELVNLPPVTHHENKMPTGKRYKVARPLSTRHVRLAC
jgi:hypothetical protein